MISREGDAESHMDLSVKDLADLLCKDEQEIREMIDKNQLPTYHVLGECRFNRAEIKAWCLEHQVKVTGKILAMDVSEGGVSLTSLISRGGCFYHVPGVTGFEVIKNAVGYISLPSGISREELAFNLLEREEMMTTAIGRGIALPHPREPLITDAGNQSVSVCFLEKPIDFKALDREPVHTLFVILSADAARHVEILSRISYLCHEDAFIDLLRNRVDLTELFDYIMVREMDWNERRRGCEATDAIP
jgi:PTS system nitrogen regulatory IIA component